MSYRTTLEPERGNGTSLGPVIALVLLLAILALVGCGGGGHRARVPKPVATVAAPQAHPTPVATHPVPCLSYTFEASADDFRAIEAAGVTGVIEYVTFPPERLCARLAPTHLKLVRAIYYGDGANRDTLEPVTQAAVRDNNLCRDRLLWTYVWDESPQREIPSTVVDWSLVSAKKAFPGVPTFIAFGEQRFDKVPPYAGLDLKGIELYARRWLDPKKLAERLDRLAGQPLVLIVRAWVDRPPCCSGAFGTWNDTDVARLIRLAMAEARRRTNVKALALYLAQSSDTSKPSQEWLEMPQTRAAIAEVCR